MASEMPGICPRTSWKTSSAVGWLVVPWTETVDCGTLFREPVARGLQGLTEADGGRFR